MTKKFLLNVFYYVSPLTILLITLLVAGLVNKKDFNGDTTSLSHQLAGMFIPSFFILAPVICLIRYATGSRPALIWIIEGILVLVTFFAVRGVIS